ncbi:hypothetical protein LTR62_004990 [Meristemomyces frigidus]|uniref:GATA-type domain-containing protein n=1 Tax=Meristemomyces frigidus TaxID=1508187 RepID=A0AAN7THN3_9PEZI|nr:hypothetical protein LTR62_004990 [Meristemomyces frigidus]
MPHALETFSAGFDEDVVATRYITEQDEVDQAAAGFADKAIDQAGKADDALDYEDFSDDDLPEEEPASAQPGLGQEEVNGLPYAVQDGAVLANGYHHSNGSANDEFLDGDETNDLFADDTSLPAQSHKAPESHQKSTGLALPGKSALALPGYSYPSQNVHNFQHTSPASTSMSPQSFQSDDFSPEASPEPASEEDEFAGLDDLERTQRMLMNHSKRRQAGERVSDLDIHVSPAEFYNFFPGYEASQNPRFIEFFPQRPVSYRGKLPSKPPKALPVTKLFLDVMPDQERSFRNVASGRQTQDAAFDGNIVYLKRNTAIDDESDDDLALSTSGDDETIGGVTVADLAMICEDWDMSTIDSVTDFGGQASLMEGEWATEEERRTKKKRRVNVLDADVASGMDAWPSLQDPERAVARLARRVTLDLNDPGLLIDEHAPQNTRQINHVSGGIRQDAALTRDLAKRYNISNDEAYDLLKENHQHKVRSTLGNSTVEHSLPAIKLQYPFYKVAMDAKGKRSFHRPSLHFNWWEERERDRKEYKFGRLRTIKRKERRGREIKELFATSDSLALNDNSSMLLLEYSEEAPIMLSNFGMGNKLINFYRKRNADDQERPKREVGETQVLLTQDKSPFANFGHVDHGEVVPTLQNGLYRAPVFPHSSKPTDFLIGVSTTQAFQSTMYLRNIENLHTVGQQLPSAEVPGQHSRRVTDAAKKRLKALAYRIYHKAQDPTRRDKVLDNATLMKHLKGHDMPQTRSKMREFMKYERNARNEGGVWVPGPGQVVPDVETLRTYVKAEEVCLLDATQVGVQRLNDLGLGSKDDEDKDPDENANIEEQLAPWTATKTFIAATQGKAMLKLYGEGDPTGRGEAFSFVKTSMKGGFNTMGESVEDKLDAKKRRENGGHTYNVAKQQKAYDDSIRRIWEKQKSSLSSNIEISDDEIDDEPIQEAQTYGRAPTPRSSFVGTPARHGDDETGTQFSRASGDRSIGRVLHIVRPPTQNSYGETVERSDEIRNPKVIKEYVRRKNEKKLASVDIYNYQSKGDKVLDALVVRAMNEEKNRIEKNVERRQARERGKGKGSIATSGTAGSPPATDAGSPAQSDIEASIANGAASSTTATPQKGRGRNKDGTARKCANCGQVGHIKTNRKSVAHFSCLICGLKEKLDGRTTQPATVLGRAKGGGKTRVDSAEPKSTGAWSTSSSFGAEAMPTFTL